MATRRPFWFLRRRTVTTDVDEELRLHVDMRIAELMADGLDAEGARQTAMRQFGDLEATRRYCREQDEALEAATQQGLLLRDIFQDVRTGVRSLRRAPALALTIIASVGLGLGATAAIFGAINATLLRPLPYAEPERLVRIYTDTPPFKFSFSAVDYLAFSARQTRFERSATYTDRAVSFAAGDSAELVRTRVVSWGFFSVLGITPAIGRDFMEDDGRPGGPAVALATHAFWQQRLGGRADALGRPIRLDGAEYTVVGVLPPTDGPLERGSDVFLIQQFPTPTRKGPFVYKVIARLPRGADWRLATAQLHAINRDLFPIWRSSYQDASSTWNMEDLKTNLLGDISTLAALAFAAVGLVWVLACTNASNLLVARATSRQADLAVRTALGASRGRLLRYLLAESAVLATGAGALGLAVAWAGMRVLHGRAAGYVPRTAEIRFDAATVWFVAALAISSALLFGLLPALQATGRSANGSMQSARTVTGGIGARRLRRGLVAAQFAIATPLLVVAALLITNLNRLRDVDLGFDTSGVLTAAIRLPGTPYREGSHARVFWAELRRRAEAVPGVSSVAFADGLPPNNVGNFNNFDLEQHPTPTGQAQPITPWVAVSSDYVRTLGLTLLEGRLLDDHDANQDDLLSVMVDRAWARRFFPNGSAVGKRLRSGGCTACPWTTVVGVVSEVKYAGLDKPDDGTVYTALAGGTSRLVVVRTTGDPLTIAGPLRQVVRQLEPSAPLSEVATMDMLVDRSLERSQSLSLLVSSFATVALLLSAIGINGAMGYYVQQHLKEICIRMALGGSRADVARLVVGQGVAVAAAGIAAGLVLAVMSTRFMSSLLFGVGTLDPSAYASAGALLVGIALVSCAVPAFRAIRLQPAAALRRD
jgi:putative ABC transport system permease protein